MTLAAATGVTEAAATQADEATGATVMVVAMVTLGLTHELEALEAATAEETLLLELSQSDHVYALVLTGSTAFVVDMLDASQSAQL